MKEKRHVMDNEEEWERLIKTHVYMGDHMTRDWTKESRNLNASSPANADPTAADLCENDKKMDRAVCPTGSQASICYEVPPTAPTKPGIYPKKSELVTRKSSSKRKLKSGKEILVHHDITEEDLLEWQKSFDALLRSPGGRYVFKIFLESEIADENLKFWLACEDLKNNTKQTRIEKRIQDIYETYINVHSSHEINIDYKMREDIVNQLKYSMDTNIFTEAQNQIYTLMHRDSYPRFLSSSFAAELAKELIERRSGKNGKHPKAESSVKSTSDLMTCCYGDRREEEEPNMVVEELVEAKDNTGVVETGMHSHQQQSTRSPTTSSSKGRR